MLSSVTQLMLAGHRMIAEGSVHRNYELDIALGTGMRKGKQYGHRWSDIDFSRRAITLRDTKNGSSRTVPMIEDVYRSFRALKGLALERKDRAIEQPNMAPEDVVFGIGDNKKWWETAVKEARIKNLRWHDLRRPCSPGPRLRARGNRNVGPLRSHGAYHPA